MQTKKSKYGALVLIPVDNIQHNDFRIKMQYSEYYGISTAVVVLVRVLVPGTGKCFAETTMEKRASVDRNIKPIVPGTMFTMFY